MAIALCRSLSGGVFERGAGAGAGRGCRSVGRHAGHLVPRRGVNAMPRTSEGGSFLFRACARLFLAVGSQEAGSGRVSRPSARPGPLGRGNPALGGRAVDLRSPPELEGQHSADRPRGLSSFAPSAGNRNCSGRPTAGFAAVPPAKSSPRRAPESALAREREFVVFAANLSLFHTLARASEDLFVSGSRIMS